MRRAFRVLLPTVVFASVGLLASCRSGEDDASGGADSTGTQSSGSKMSTSSTMATTGTNTGSSSNSSTGTGTVGCDGPEHTVSDITTGVVGKGTKLTLKGVVAMSQIFSVSAGNSCLWGVFVSAPGLTETAENTGVLVLSYGSPPAIPPGGDMAFCPAVGSEPLGSAFPDDLKPGDVFDFVGVADEFPNDFANCTGANPPNTVGQKQLSQVCKATKTGNAPLPAPHVLTAAEIASLSSTTDKAFHDKWGAVKVRVEDPTLSAIDEFGLTLTAGASMVYDSRKSWYRPISPNKQCHGKDLNYMTGQVFDRVDGFHYLSFCTWGITSSDRCGDFSPTSMACTTAGTTTCAEVQ